MGGETSVRGINGNNGEVRKDARNNGIGSGVLSERRTSAEGFETSGEELEMFS